MDEDKRKQGKADMAQELLKVGKEIATATNAGLSPVRQAETQSMPHAQDGQQSKHHEDTPLEPRDYDWRLDQLDSLSAILPHGTDGRRNETLAQLLTSEDVETLRHLAKEGMGKNSLRALTSDFGYLDGWHRAVSTEPLPWPAPQSLVLKFIAHHLWSQEERAKNPAHGMPQDVKDHLTALGLLRKDGPHAPSTVQRRLASWATLHRWRGLDGCFSDPAIRSALRLAVRVADRPRGRKSKKPITADILETLLLTCAGSPPSGPSLQDRRDKAILMLGFASGGRRRSEIADLRMSQIETSAPVLSDPSDPDSKLLPCLNLSLGRTKTENAQDENEVVLIGRSAQALLDWLAIAKITDGPVFRAIDQWGKIKDRALTAQSINLVLKSRIAKAGLDPADYSAHGLRSGFLTEAANRDIPLQDAMLQSRHKSVAQAARYYSEAGKSRRRSARLLD
ncbi:MAG: tyrosine-type recombinase/integrase [Cohaesibacter sp.]|jgi:integrase|nr:tyrosine-type recombinase/integrase [Cohaesibacter sp.]